MAVSGGVGPGESEPPAARLFVRSLMSWKIQLASPAVKIVSRTAASLGCWETPELISFVPRASAYSCRDGDQALPLAERPLVDS